MLGRPGMAAYKLHEGTPAEFFTDHAVLSLCNSHQSLFFRVANGHHESAPNGKLRRQRLWYDRATRCNKDPVVGRVHAPTYRAVKRLDCGVIASDLANVQHRHS